MDGISTLKSLAYHGLRKPGFFRPFRESARLPAVRDYPVVGLVSSLFRHACPATIARRVSERVVYPVYGRPLIRRGAHIGKKSREVIPAFTNGDAAGSVPSVCLSSRVSAPLFHRSPCVVRWSSIASVLARGRANARGAPAATTLRGTAFKASGNDYLRRPARATALDDAMAVLAFTGLRDKQQFSELIADVCFHARQHTTECPDITADLLALAGEADQVVLQLTACQAIVTADRKDSP